MKDNRAIKEIVLGIVKSKVSEILIVKRSKKEKGKDGSTLTWAFPGGGVEKDEDRNSAIEREVLEETGYKVRAGKMISERRHPQFPVYIYYIECFLVTGEPRQKIADPEIVETKFVKSEELHEYFTSDLDSRVLKYLNNR